MNEQKNKIKKIIVRELIPLRIFQAVLLIMLIPLMLSLFFVPIIGQAAILLALFNFGAAFMPRMAVMGTLFGINGAAHNPFRFVFFKDDGLKISGLEKIEEKNIRAVVIMRVAFIKFEHIVFYEEDDILVSASFFTFFRRYKTKDASKTLIVPGYFPKSMKYVMDRIELLPFVPIPIGRKSPFRRQIEFYTNNESIELAQDIVITGTGGCIIGDAKYFNYLKKELDDKRSLTELDLKDVYKFPFFEYATTPFCNINISRNGDLYFTFNGFTYCIKKQFIREIKIQKSLTQQAVTFIHNDINFIERITFFGTDDVITKVGNFYLNTITPDDKNKPSFNSVMCEKNNIVPSTKKRKTLFQDIVSILAIPMVIIFCMGIMFLFQVTLYHAIMLIPHNEDKAVQQNDEVEDQDMIKKEDIAQDGNNLSNSTETKTNTKQQDDKLFVRCAQLQDASKRVDCYYAIAHSDTNINACKYIDNKENQGNCYGEIATKLNDPKMCLKAESKDVRDKCLMLVANYKGMAQICDILEVADDKKDECYNNVAATRLDPVLCDKIIDANKKKYCIQRVTELKEGY